MSSPLLGELRERRGLVYHAACAADRYESCGQFAVEASFAPDKLDEVLRGVMRLLQRQAQTTDAVDLERARNQIAVRLLRDADRPSRRMEQAALDLFSLGRVRPIAEQLERLEGVDAEAASEAFQRMLGAGIALAHDRQRRSSRGGQGERQPAVARMTRRHLKVAAIRGRLDVSD